DCCRRHRPHHRRSGADRQSRASCGRPAAWKGSLGVITTNLSTRPFYNERVVHFWLLMAAFVLGATTMTNVSRLRYYSRSDTELATETARDETRSAELRASAAKLRGSVDAKQIESAS